MLVATDVVADRVVLFRQARGHPVDALRGGVALVAECDRGVSQAADRNGGSGEHGDFGTQERREHAETAGEFAEVQRGDFSTQRGRGSGEGSLIRRGEIKGGHEACQGRAVFIDGNGHAVQGGD